MNTNCISKKQHKNIIFVCEKRLLIDNVENLEVKKCQKKNFLVTQGNMAYLNMIF